MENIQGSSVVKQNQVEMAKRLLPYCESLGDKVVLNFYFMRIAPMSLYSICE